MIKREPTSKYLESATGQKELKRTVLGGRKRLGKFARQVCGWSMLKDRGEDGDEAGRMSGSSSPGVSSVIKRLRISF